MGPTASGKTDLAASLLSFFPVEIISVDATLVYRGMDIGSAKPDAEFLKRAPHHLLDIRDPAEPYSVADFASDVIPLIDEISTRGRIPLLVGGSMLYFKVLLEGLSSLPSRDDAVRESIRREADRLGWPEMHRQLSLVDPKTAACLHPNHSQRIQRALEIYRISGQPASAHKTGSASTRQAFGAITDRYRVVQIALMPNDRTLLHGRIAARFEGMLERGLIDEVVGLRARGDLNRELPSMRAVGYRQVWDYLEGEISLDDMEKKAIAATRQLAKRQITWLRGWSDLHVVETDEAGVVLEQQKILDKCLKILMEAPISIEH